MLICFTVKILMGFDYRVLLQTPLGVLSNIQDMHHIPILYLTEFQNTSGSKPFGYRIRDLFNRKKKKKKENKISGSDKQICI